jgi:site-specific DNA-methyltransferase (adenine-specific)
LSLYYEDEHVQLHHGGCRAVRGWTTADVLVTDPPYGQDYRSNRADETSRVARAIANDSTTAVRDEALALWGERPRIVFEGREVEPLQHQARLVWHKPGSGMGDLSMPWKPDYEFISVSGGGFVGSRDTSVLTYPLRVFRGDLEHPHMKPIGLMESLIGKCPRGVVLADPFAGSGSTVVAARNLGYRIIAVELEEKYCELIVKRLSQQAFDFSALEAS